MTMKRIFLALLIVPSALLWALMCTAAIGFYGEGIISGDFQVFPVVLLSIIGLSCLAAVVTALFKYPKTTIFLAYSISLGIVTMLIGMYTFWPLFNPILAISAISLLIGSIFLLIEHIRHT